MDQTNTTLLKNWFEELASKKLSATREKPIRIHIGKKSLMYRYTMARLKQLLNTVDDDLELAKMIIFIQFNGPEFKWRSRNSVTDLLSDWDAAKAIAESIREKEKEEEDRHKPFEVYADAAWEELFG